jgi:hypothetical protein
MFRIQKDLKTKNLDMNDLNKVTLSIVKNVVKNKLSLDKSSFNTLTRERDIDNNEVNLHKMSRPQQSNDQMENVDVIQQHDTFMEVRNKEDPSLNITSFKTQSSSFDLDLDGAISNDDFLKKMNDLTQNRNIDINTTNYNIQKDVLKDVQQDSTFNKGVLIENETLSKIFQENYTDHPKELYTTNINNVDEILKAREKNESRLGFIPTITKPNRELLTKYLIIDSRDRNMDIYPDPANYVINLENIVKNLVEVELIYALYNKNDTDTYVNLQIEEFLPDTVSNNHNIREAFVQLPMLNHINEFTSNRISATKIFKQPMNKLSRISIKFVKYDGSLHDIGDHFMKFQIKLYNHSDILDKHSLDHSDILYKNDMKSSLESSSTSDSDDFNRDVKPNDEDNEMNEIINDQIDQIDQIDKIINLDELFPT